MIEWQLHPAKGALICKYWFDRQPEAAGTGNFLSGKIFCQRICYLENYVILRLWRFITMHNFYFSNIGNNLLYHPLISLLFVLGAKFGTHILK